MVNMGTSRDKRGGDRHRNRPTQVRLTPRMRQQLEAMAERNCSTISAEIVAALLARLQAQGWWPPPEGEKEK